MYKYTITNFEGRMIYPVLLCLKNRRIFIPDICCHFSALQNRQVNSQIDNSFLTAPQRG